MGHHGAGAWQITGRRIPPLRVRVHSVRHVAALGHDLPSGAYLSSSKGGAARGHVCPRSRLNLRRAKRLRAQVQNEQASVQLRLVIFPSAFMTGVRSSSYLRQARIRTIRLDADMADADAIAFRDCGLVVFVLSFHHGNSRTSRNNCSG